MCGMLVLVDRENGRSTSITLYHDEQSLEDSRDAARMLRQMMEQRMDLRRHPRLTQGRRAVLRHAAPVLGPRQPRRNVGDDVLDVLPDVVDRDGVEDRFLRHGCSLYKRACCFTGIVAV